MYNKRALLGLLIIIVLAVPLTFFILRPTVRATQSPLTWSPPACGDATHSCVDLNLVDTGSNQTPSLSSSNDYRIHLPSTPLRGGFQIRGGHNIIVIGGEIDLTVPCTTDSAPCHGINISKPTAGQVFIEGVWIHNPQSPITQSTGDGIDVDDTATAPNDLTLENVRIDGISGGSGGPDHADVFQPYAAANARVHIDSLTGTSNFQGMQIDPDLAYSRDGTYASEYIIKNVNINTLSNPYSGNNNRYQWWLTYNLACNSGPITLSNVYTQEPNGTLNGNSVWPDIDQPAACKSVWNSTTNQLTFPSSPQISGLITEGIPPGGDFVPLGVAGIGYVSPGYQGQSSSTIFSASASSGVISSPFAVGSDTHGSYVAQTRQTAPCGARGAGKASYTFTVPTTGNYTVGMVVNAPDTGTNSLCVAIDAAATNDTMCWDVGVTGAGVYQSQLASWRGNGTPDANQYVPKVFSLSAGTHTLIITGREANTRFSQVSVQTA